MPTNTTEQLALGLTLTAPSAAPQWRHRRLRVRIGRYTTQCDTIRLDNGALHTVRENGVVTSTTYTPAARTSP